MRIEDNGVVVVAYIDHYRELGLQYRAIRAPIKDVVNEYLNSTFDMEFTDEALVEMCVDTSDVSVAFHQRSYIFHFELAGRFDHIHTTGRYLGYPPCCVAEYYRNVGFVQHRRDKLDYSAYSQTGFIPCKACLAKDKEEVFSYIDKHRTATSRFPNSNVGDRLEMILKIIHGEFEPVKVTECYKEKGLLDLKVQKLFSKIEFFEQTVSRVLETLTEHMDDTDIVYAETEMLIRSETISTLRGMLRVLSEFSTEMSRSTDIDRYLNGRREAEIYCNHINAYVANAIRITSSYTLTQK